MKKEPVWAAKVNLGGLYKLNPLRCTWDKELNCWWGDDGNFEVRKLGLDAQDLCITFASKSKTEVAIWLLGATSVMSLLKQWTGGE